MSAGHCRHWGRAALRLSAALLLLILGERPLRAADAVESFYSGKNIQLLIGYSPGGGYDIYARVLARHMSRHIPGHPTIVAQNMPGAGSLKLANYLFAVAPKDGTVVGTFARGMAMEPLLGGAGARFDASKFTWIGSITDEVSVCAFWHTSPIHTWDDMLKQNFTVGGTGSGADTDVFPNVLRNMFHAKLKLVTGFPGGADIILALERGEVNGRCGWSWSSLISRNRTLYETQQIYVPVQMAMRKHEDLPNTPLIMDMTKDPKEITALRLILSRQTMARPYAAPPGVPEDRKAALRAAFDATMKDPEFLADAKGSDLELRPVSGTEIEKLVAEMYAAPQDVVQLAAKAVVNAR
jgi:tripartite-type tricarboxylate transporter receptor subunit TctC